MKNIAVKYSVKITSLVAIFILLTTFLLTPTAYAEEDVAKPWENKTWYFGLGFSSNEVTLPVGKKISGDETTYASADDSALGWKLLLGMNYKPNLDAAFTYQNIGSYESRIRSVFADKQLEGIVNTDLEYQTFNLELRPKYNLGKSFNIQGLAGLSYILAERSPDVTVKGGQHPDDLVELQNTLDAEFKNESENKLALVYGFSFVYHWSEKYALGYELNYSAHGEQDISMHQVVLTRRIK